MKNYNKMEKFERALLIVLGMILGVLIFSVVGLVEIAIYTCNLQKEDSKLISEGTNDDYIDPDLDIGVMTEPDPFSVKNPNELFSGQYLYGAEEMSDNDDSYVKLSQDSIPVSCSTKITSITNDEFELLCENVYAMSADMSFETQCAIAEVIFNRVDSDNYDNTLGEVLCTFYESKVLVADNIFPQKKPIIVDIDSEYWQSVRSAVMSVISDDKNIIWTPGNVTVITGREYEGLEQWSDDLVDEKLHFYYEGDGSLMISN